MDKKPPLSRQKSVFLDFLDEVKEEEKVYMPQANDMIEYDCPSCYIPFNTDIELSEHIILSTCFLEKLEKQKESHRIEIESMKIRIKYLEDKLEWFRDIFQKMMEFLQSL